MLFFRILNLVVGLRPISWDIDIDIDIDLFLDVFSSPESFKIVIDIFWLKLESFHEDILFKIYRNPAGI